ncbi:protein-L-isoaspartate O-methyltransferase [Patescibacteria group bacterium]|nr:protein-L-isoaspartate O-methyltransferase [Patescibacteria group bacterium]
MSPVFCYDGAIVENSLAAYLERIGVLKPGRVLDAFAAIDRADFVPEELRASAYVDEPLLIGSGQTISQPYVVAFMLNLLDPEPGEKIMDIGAGSGWQTALLAHIVGEEGKVFALERIPELCEFGRSNVSKYNFTKKGIVEWFCQDATKGLRQRAPFDKTIAAAALDGEIPQAWKDQLNAYGKMVVPIDASVWLFHKQKDGTFHETEFPGFAFVPFLKDEDRN